MSKSNILISRGDSSSQVPAVQKYLRGTSKNPYRAIIVPDGFVERNSGDPNVGKVNTSYFILHTY